MSIASARSGTAPADRLAAVNEPGKRSIPLDLKPALAHLRPDEHTSIQLEGVPEGMRLSDGSADANNVWSLTIAQLEGLTVIAPAGYRGHSPLSVNLVRRDPQGGAAETVSNFGMLLTPDGATSAFGELEPEERDGSSDSVVRLRSQVSKGRGLLSVKTTKRALDFGDSNATAAFAAHRSTEHLNALLRGDLAYNDGATSEASLQVEQRLTLARTLWEGEAAKRLADARKEWETEKAQLSLRLRDLEAQASKAADDLKRMNDQRGDWQNTVRSRLIEVVTRLNDEHAAELAEIEQRLKNEADEMLAAARAEWERRS